MNNLLTYCGLVDVRINASDKDLPVTDATFNIVQLTPPNSYTYDARKKDYLTFMAMTNECLAVILMNDIKSSGFLL